MELPNTQPCLRCHKEIDNITDPFGEDSPNPGDATVCSECGHVMCFDDNLRFREITEAEKLELDTDEDSKIRLLRKALGITNTSSE